ncbi:MAG: hypothetical protein PHG25_04390 [Candidatus Pacebacteria bacterium]|nr:hypothetical protein [Candidatus Paceibacterota bacterium]
MARTALEIQAELDIVNAALQSLYTGTRLTELRIDTNLIRRYYKYSEVNIESLLGIKQNLEQELLGLTATTPTFRSFSNLPIIVNKQGVY